MHHLVTEDRSELCFVAQFHQQAAIDGEFAAWALPGGKGERRRRYARR